LCIENEKAINNDFNLSTPVSTTVKELATLIWEKINGDKPLTFIHDQAYEYDVQKRVPSVAKAKEVLGFEANTDLSATLDEVIPWVKQQVELGNI
jgi:nucleoside-diphosphate-sugar epimerase